MSTKQKLICILGRTCTGKDAMSYVLEIFHGIHPLVSYTTRPIRDYEVEGESHYFISDDEYEHQYRDLKKLGYTKINGYHYFTLYDQLFKNDEHIYSYIVDPEGLNYIRERFKDQIDIVTIYVKCSQEYQEKRYNNREEEISIPFMYRNLAEDEQFTLFEETEEKNCDIVINTDNIDLRALVY